LTRALATANDETIADLVAERRSLRYHEPMWNMLRGERDMVVVDLAS
jgi:hypothetical protein